jgi:hypothetical protein
MSQKLHCRIEKKRNIVVASFLEQCRKFLRCDLKSLDLIKTLFKCHIYVKDILYYP